MGEHLECVVVDPLAYEDAEKEAARLVDKLVAGGCVPTEVEAVLRVCLGSIISC